MKTLFTLFFLFMLLPLSGQVLQFEERGYTLSGIINKANEQLEDKEIALPYAIGTKVWLKPSPYMDLHDFVNFIRRYCYVYEDMKLNWRESVDRKVIALFDEPEISDEAIAKLLEATVYLGKTDKTPKDSLQKAASQLGKSGVLGIPDTANKWLDIPDECTMGELVDTIVQYYRDHNGKYVVPVYGPIAVKFLDFGQVPKKDDASYSIAPPASGIDYSPLHTFEYPEHGTESDAAEFNLVVEEIISFDPRPFLGSEFQYELLRYMILPHEVEGFRQLEKRVKPHIIQTVGSTRFHDLLKAPQRFQVSAYREKRAVRRLEKAWIALLTKNQQEVAPAVSKKGRHRLGLILESGKNAALVAESPATTWDNSERDATSLLLRYGYRLDKPVNSVWYLSSDWEAQNRTRIDGGNRRVEFDRLAFSASLNRGFGLRGVLSAGPFLEGNWDTGLIASESALDHLFIRGGMNIHWYDWQNTAGKDLMMNDSILYFGHLAPSGDEEELTGARDARMVGISHRIAFADSRQNIHYGPWVEADIGKWISDHVLQDGSYFNAGVGYKLTSPRSCFDLYMRRDNWRRNHAKTVWKSGLDFSLNWRKDRRFLLNVYLGNSSSDIAEEDYKFSVVQMGADFSW